MSKSSYVYLSLSLVVVCFWILCPANAFEAWQRGTISTACHNQHSVTTPLHLDTAYTDNRMCISCWFFQGSGNRRPFMLVSLLWSDQHVWWLAKHSAHHLLQVQLSDVFVLRFSWLSYHRQGFSSFCGLFDWRSAPDRCCIGNLYIAACCGACCTVLHRTHVFVLYSPVAICTYFCLFLGAERWSC